MPYPVAAAGASQINTIPAENDLPGTVAWNDLTGQDQTHLAAYAGKVNIVAGDTLPFYVASDVAACTADIYRLGWYGGKGGRKLATIAFNATNKLATGALTATYSMGGTIGVPINMWTCNYDGAFFLPTLSTWVSGLYLARIYQTAGSRYPTWVPFTVSQPASQATYLCWLNDTTWQAYNAFGGYSIYVGAGGFSARVSYDRPWIYSSAYQDFSTWNLPFVRWLEKNGYDVTYCGAAELDNDPMMIRRHPVFITPGHNEYWSKRIFNNIRSGRDHGTSLGFFCANTGYKRIRWLSSATGPQRQFECYEHFPYADPMGKMADRAGQSRWGGDWENTLTGVAYGSLCTGSPNVYSFVCADGSNWAFAGTGMATNDKIDRIMGYEIDVKQPTAQQGAPPSPAGLQTLGASPVTTSGPDSTAHTTYYQHASGAGVFAAGTVSWPWGLDNYRAPFLAAQDYTDARLGTITANILRRLAATGKTSAV